MSAPTTARSPGFLRTHRLELLAFALLAYVPFLLSSPGEVSADTKQYLYLDPGRLPRTRAVPVGPARRPPGTVPHQHIGYLFPMGPYFWADGAARRARLGGAAALARHHLVRRRRRRALARSDARCPAAPARSPARWSTCSRRTSSRSPARISVLLLPWAALPWLVGLTMRVPITQRRLARSRARSRSWCWRSAA